MASIAALLRGRTGKLTRHLATAIKGDIRGVHQGRVTSRRLRESLPMAGGAAAARARKAFREITRALGPVRELDVALQHLEDGLQGIQIPRIAIERVRAHVLTERNRRRERMLSRLDRVDLSGAILRVHRAARSAKPEVSIPSAKALATRVRTRALTLETVIDRAGTLYDPDRLHDVRIAGKKLRYALEVVASIGLGSHTREIRLLKRAQQVLGLMHDYQVLLEHVAAVADATPKGTPGAAGLRSMAGAYDRECRKLHAQYLKIAPSLARTASTLRKLELKVRKNRA